MTEHLDQFIETLRSEKYYSPHTCANYRRDLDQFQDYLQQLGIEADRFAGSTGNINHELV